MKQHEEKSDGASTAAAAVAMSALLQKSSMMSTSLEMSTATSQGEERQPKRQHDGVEYCALDSFDLLQAQGKQAQSGLESFPPRVRHRA